MSKRLHDGIGAVSRRWCRPFRALESFVAFGTWADATLTDLRQMEGDSPKGGLCPAWRFNARGAEVRPSQALKGRPIFRQSATPVGFEDLYDAHTCG
jgi:hypothetical protein